MKRWDIYEYDYVTSAGTPWGEYPFVIISSDTMCLDNQEESVYALICRPTPPVHVTTEIDVWLDHRDELQKKYPCRCNHIYSLQKYLINSRMGSVSKQNQILISETLKRELQLNLEAMYNERKF